MTWEASFEGFCLLEHDEEHWNASTEVVCVYCAIEALCNQSDTKGGVSVTLGVTVTSTSSRSRINIVDATVGVQGVIVTTPPNSASAL